MNQLNKVPKCVIIFLVQLTRNAWYDGLFLHLKMKCVELNCIFWRRRNQQRCPQRKRSLNTFGRHITITFLSFAAAIPNESCTNIYAPCDQISSGAWRVNSVLLREQPSHCLIFFVLCLLLKCIALTWEVDSRRETSLGTFYNILLTVHAV